MSIFISWKAGIMGGVRPSFFQISARTAGDAVR